MRTWLIASAAASALAALGAAAYWLLAPPPPLQMESSSEGTGRILYYRDPSGAPNFSPVPKKDAQGRDYIAVRAVEPAKTAAAAQPQRKILYYRNPMGLPDTSPVPKKDNMGMDYIPVYADEETAAPAGTVRISLDRVQRLGVRTAFVERRAISQLVRAAATIEADERKLSVVTLKFDGYIGKLRVAATGETVRAGEPLFELESPFLLQQETHLALALRGSEGTGDLGGTSARANSRIFATVRDRLRLYEVPEHEIARLVRTGKPSGKVTWLAPRGGVVTEKLAVSGMRVAAGDVLYRIADLSTVWAIADIPEALLGSVSPRAPAAIKLKAYPGRSFDGVVDFIYPSVAMATRTAKVRVELANAQRLLLPGMFADVEITPKAETPSLAVPESALIDSGTRQLVLLSRGNGLFEPRLVVAGKRSGDFVEIKSGLAEGEEVVTSATFLIDAESNLRSALQSFTAGAESPK